MPVVSITRLSVRSWWYLPPFFFHAYCSARQAARSDGSLGVRLLRDRHRTFWTSTAWTSEAAMKAFMHAAPHGPAMRKLLDWCDEAALVHWTQDTADLPTWDEAHRRLQQDGRLSKVNHPAPGHTARVYAMPAVGRTGELRFKS